MKSHLAHGLVGGISVGVLFWRRSREKSAHTSQFEIPAARFLGILNSPQPGLREFLIG